MEEKVKGKWTFEHALLGFTCMNTSHNGVCLGQALFKICNQLGIVHKVCLKSSIQITLLILNF